MVGSARCTRLLFVAACAACASPPPHEQQVTQAVTQCGSNLPEGVDVYSGTGTIDWSSVASSGRSFAFIKATQGNYNQQSTFGSNWSGALAAGVLRSPYHFFDGTISGSAQAQWFLDELNSAGGLAVGDLPPMLDIECPTSSDESSTESGCEYSGDSGWVPSATLQQEIFDWLDAVQTATGTTPILYSYVSWFADVGVTDARLADYPLYIASYNSCATIPAPWGSATFWQYSATTSVPGIAAPGDVDRFFGTLDQLTGLTIQPAGSGSGSDGSGSGSDDGSGSSAATCDHGGCASNSTPSAWWLAGFAALVIGIRSQRQKPRARKKR